MRRFLRNIARKVSDFFRGTVRIVGSLFGVKWHGEWVYDSLLMAGWIFLLGLPLGALLFSAEMFSIGLWLTIVLTVLMIVNMDDALLLMSNYLSYGVDGVVEGDENLPTGETNA